jgi:hypothetical protein
MLTEKLCEISRKFVGEISVNFAKVSWWNFDEISRNQIYFRSYFVIRYVKIHFRDHIIIKFEKSTAKMFCYTPIH